MNKRKFKKERRANLANNLLEWNTIPVELLENILIATASPYDVANACRACKAWRAVDQGKHVWKGLYKVLSNIYIDDTDDCKNKVVDLVLVRENVKKGRCVVRTLCTSQRLTMQTMLDFDNLSVNKDHCLVNWLTIEDYGYYGSVNRTYSHLINMVTEDVVQIDKQKILFLNNYLALSPSSYYYGRATYNTVQVRHFDPTSEPLDLSFEGAEFNMPNVDRTIIQNYCNHSNFIGFVEFGDDSASTIDVVNAETGQIVYSYSVKLQASSNTQMYDNILVIQQKDTLAFVDILTGKKTSKHFVPPVHPGFMNDRKIAVRTGENIVLYDYKNKTEVIYPAEQTPKSPVVLIYHDMWLFSYKGTLGFYSMKDGSRINCMSLTHVNMETVGLLSDGRLAVIHRSGCSVVSFVNSEVNRKIKVALMKINGHKTILTNCIQKHKISAYELANFYVRKVCVEIKYMISRVVPYGGPKKATADTRFVMIFSQLNESQAVNPTATNLFNSAVTPTHVNTPYRGWQVEDVPILEKNQVTREVRAVLSSCKRKKSMVDGS